MNKYLALESMDAAYGAMDHIIEIVRRLRAANSTTSLIDVARPARVEPVLVVDADVMNLPYIDDCSQTMLKLFCGYYLQAAAMVTSGLSVKSMGALAQLNPSRDVGLRDALDLMIMAKENLSDPRRNPQAYQFRLPGRNYNPNEPMTAALESVNVKEQLIEKGLDTAKTLVDDALTPVGAQVSGAISGKNSEFLDVSSLSVGKMLDVTINEGEKSGVIKIAVRLIASTVPSSAVVTMLTVTSKDDHRWTDRRHALSEGRIEFWKDFIFHDDIMSARRKALIQDKSGVYAEILKRQRGHGLAGIITGKPSLAQASNLFIISSETLEAIEYKHGGKIKDLSVRKEIFGETSLMILAVIDAGMNRVKFYHRGIDLPTDLSVTELKSSSKGGGGADITEIMKTLLSGSAPVL